MFIDLLAWTQYIKSSCVIILSTIKYPNSAIYCAGDFNLPDIDWSNNSIKGYRNSNTINNLALNMIAECSFSQMVTFLTRLNNTLDLVFTNRPSLIQHCFPAPGISDYSVFIVTALSRVNYIIINHIYGTKQM